MTLRMPSKDMVLPNSKPAGANFMASIIIIQPPIYAKTRLARGHHLCTGQRGPYEGPCDGSCNRLRLNQFVLTFLNFKLCFLFNDKRKTLSSTRTSDTSGPFKNHPQDAWSRWPWITSGSVDLTWQWPSRLFAMLMVLSVVQGVFLHLW